MERNRQLTDARIRNSFGAKLGKHSTHVFGFRGHPVRQVNIKAWRLALGRAGIAEFRWHDLRHTWASWHVHARTPLHVLQDLGGWECVEMVRKYAHFSTVHLAEFVDFVSSVRLVASQDVATIGLYSGNEKGAASLQPLLLTGAPGRI
jgi:integrase